jgi:hypothetical protein
LPPNLAADLDSAARRYEAEFRNVLDRNSAQELSPDYAGTGPDDRTSRTRWSVATLGVAGGFIDWLYPRRLAALPPDSLIAFNAGGQGSGKTTATRAAEVERAADLLMDGTLQDEARSRQQIDAALGLGHLVQIRFAYCPWEKAVANILRRAGEGSGRVVPLARAARGHFQAARTVLSLADAPLDNPDDVFVFDNSDFLNPVQRDLRWLRQQLHESVEKLLETGRIAADQSSVKIATQNQDLCAERNPRPLLPNANWCSKRFSAPQRGYPHSASPAGQERNALSIRSRRFPQTLPVPRRRGLRLRRPHPHGHVKGDVHDIGKNIVGVVSPVTTTR